MVLVASIIAAILVLHHVSLEMRMLKMEHMYEELAESFARLRSVWWEGVQSRYPFDDAYEKPDTFEVNNG